MALSSSTAPVCAVPFSDKGFQQARGCVCASAWLKPATPTSNAEPFAAGYLLAAGVIMMLNAAGCNMFGYDKGELEGKNVSCLM